MDPANIRAHARSARGLERELTQRRTQNPPHPRRGGTRGYPLWQRVKTIRAFNRTLDYDFAADIIGCHPISVRRWEERLMPHRMGDSKTPNNGCRSTSTFDLHLYLPRRLIRRYLCVHHSERRRGLFKTDRF